jgi:hypothetical protein
LATDQMFVLSRKMVRVRLKGVSDMPGRKFRSRLLWSLLGT